MQLFRLEHITYGDFLGAKGTMEVGVYRLHSRVDDSRCLGWGQGKYIFEACKRTPRETDLQVSHNPCTVACICRVCCHLAS